MSNPSDNGGLTQTSDGDERSREETVEMSDAD